VGWKSVKNPLDFDHLHFELRDDAAKLEEGTQSFATILGMGAALALLDEVGIDRRIALHITAWLEEADKIPGQPKAWTPARYAGFARAS
jgi:selenocysteine lyase/cysteine desulfurase